MVKLSDFVEAVLREVTAARIKAALASARIAADLRDDPLLAGLPVPTYRMERAEFEIRFAVAEVTPPPSGRLLLPRERTLRLVERAVTALPGSGRAAKAFEIVPRLGELWKLEAAQRVLADLGEERLEEMSLAGVVALCAGIVENRYLEMLTDSRARASLRRIREVVAKGFPDRVAGALRAELREALEKAAAEERQRQPAEAAVELLVTAAELEKAREVSTLKLVLEEDEVELALPPSEGGEEE